MCDVDLSLVRHNWEKRLYKTLPANPQHTSSVLSLSLKTSPGTNNKQTNCYNKQTAPTTVRTNLFSSGAFLLLLCSCLILSHANLCSVRLELLLTSFELLLTCFEFLLTCFELLSLAAADKRGNVRENTAGSCQWLLTVT